MQTMTPTQVMDIANDVMSIREKINNLNPRDMYDVIALNEIKEAHVVLLNRLQGLCAIHSFP